MNRLGFAEDRKIRTEFANFEFFIGNVQMQFYICAEKVPLPFAIMISPQIERRLEESQIASDVTVESCLGAVSQGSYSIV